MEEIEKKLNDLLKEIEKSQDLDRFGAMAFLQGMLEFNLREYIEE